MRVRGWGMGWSLKGKVLKLTVCEPHFSDIKIGRKRVERNECFRETNFSFSYGEKVYWFSNLFPTFSKFL